MRFPAAALLLVASITLPPPWANAAEAAAVSPASRHEPDYSAWQKLLSRYLDTAAADGVHRFRYGAVTPGDKEALAACLAALQTTMVSALPSDAQRAFWINLYNAQTVSSVLRAYPIKSIRDIKTPGSNAQGPWDAKAMKVEGRDLSLNDIENGILRKQWHDNRIHFALNCASLGCPDLSPRAFTAANLEAQLRKGAREFLRSKRGAEFMEAQGNVSVTGPGLAVLRLSSIFEWYKEDFGKDDAEVLQTLGRLVEAGAGPGAGKRFREYKGKIEYQYDWSLNGG